MKNKIFMKKKRTKKERILKSHIRERIVEETRKFANAKGEKLNKIFENK